MSSANRPELLQLCAASAQPDPRHSPAAPAAVVAAAAASAHTAAVPALARRHFNTDPLAEQTTAAENEHMASHLSR